MGCICVLGVYFVRQNIGTQNIVLGFLIQYKKAREKVKMVRGREQKISRWRVLTQNPLLPLYTTPWLQRLRRLRALGKRVFSSGTPLLTEDPYVPGTVSGSLLCPRKASVCPSGTAPQAVAMRSWLHAGRSQLTPRLRCVMGCSLRAAAATTFTLYSGQERERESAREGARAHMSTSERTSLPHSKMFLTKSGTPGSNQNTELWNKLTFHSPRREGEFSLDNFSSQPQQK